MPFLLSPSIPQSLHPRSIPTSDTGYRPRLGSPGQREMCGAVPPLRGLYTRWVSTGTFTGTRGAAGTARDNRGSSSWKWLQPRPAGHGLGRERGPWAPEERPSNLDGSRPWGLHVLSPGKPVAPGRCPRAFPGPGSPRALGCHGTLPPPCARVCPGRSRHSCPCAPRAVPGYPGLFPFPAPSVRPEPSGAVPGYSGTSSALRRELSRAVPRSPPPVPVPVPAERVRGTAGKAGGGSRELWARGRGAATRRANPGRDGQPRRRRSRRPVRDAAAPPLPIVRARTRGGPARRDRPTGTLRAAPIRGKGLEDAPGC